MLELALTWSDIFNRAIALYVTHWKKFLPLIGVVFLSGYLPWMVGEYLLPQFRWYLPFFFVWTMLLFVLVPAGIARMALAIWRGEEPRGTMLFWYCRSRAFWVSGLLFGVFYGLLRLLRTIPNMPWSPPLLLIPVFCIYYRFPLMPYLYATNRTMGVIEAAKESFSRMTGHVWKLIGFTLIMDTAAFVLSFAYTQLATSIMGGRGWLSAGTHPLYWAGTYLIAALSEPVIALATAGFLDPLLPAGEDTEERPPLYPKGELPE